MTLYPDSLLCQLIHPYCDGELDDLRVVRFEDHLADCLKCQSVLHDIFQLRGAIEQDRPSAKVEQSRSRPRHKVSKALPFVLVPLALAAAAAILLWLRPKSSPPPFFAAAMRTQETRLSHPGAFAHRPYDALRAATPQGEIIPDSVRQRLLVQDDHHGLASLNLLEGRWDHALLELGQARGSRDDLDSDRAVAHLGRGQSSEALSLLQEVIKRNPRHGAALWNQALTLRELGLELSAAARMESVVALRESGWSSEARARMESLRSLHMAKMASWSRIQTEGPTMVTTGQPLPHALARTHAGIARVYLYEAVRSAASPEIVKGLLPLAKELDRLDKSTLAAYLGRVVAADFSRRWPLAAEYRQLAQAPRSFSQDRGRSLIARARAAGQIDIALGTLFHLGVTKDNLVEYQGLAKSSGEAWFQLMALDLSADVAQRQGKHAEAEALYLEGIGRCAEQTLEYRCAFIEQDLALLLLSQNRLVEATAYTRSMLHRAERIGQVNLELMALQLLAEISRQRDEYPLALSYLQELELRANGQCEIRRLVHENLALFARSESRPADALRELSESPSCGTKKSLLRLSIEADLLRVFHQKELQPHQIMDDIRSIRRAGYLNAGDALHLDAIEGAVLLGLQKSHGLTALETVIQKAAQHPEDAQAQAARAYAGTALLRDAAQAGDTERTLNLFTLELGLAPMPSCMLAVEYSDEHLIVASRGPDGSSLLKHEVRLGSLKALSDSEVASLVPPPMRDQMRGCPMVHVVARPPLFGRAFLLPAEIAWSYRVMNPREREPVTQRRRVVVGDPRPPQHLSPFLRPLVSPPPDGDDARVDLQGASATPQRVLSEIQDATEIELHTHGLVDQHYFEEAALVLSPQADGRYTLSAADIAALPLRGAPVVLLAACQAAQGTAERARQWNLPVAFLRAGARTVIAPTTVIPDGGALRFFSSLAQRIRDGAAPAVALRDERNERLAEDPNRWSFTKNILIFE